MNFQKIVKIVAGLLGILGVVFLLRIIGAGDEEIKMQQPWVISVRYLH